MMEIINKINNEVAAVTGITFADVVAFSLTNLGLVVFLAVILFKFVTKGIWKTFISVGISIIIFNFVMYILYTTGLITAIKPLSEIAKDVLGILITTAKN